VRAVADRPGGAVIRVVVADDHALVRSGFRLILDAQPDIEVVADVADGREAVLAARRHAPDVVLLDIRMPVLDGLAATAQIVTGSTAPRVLILTTYDTDSYLYEAMRAGASGFLLKDVRPEQLAAAVRTIAAGDALFAPSIIRRLVEEFVHRPPPGARAPSPLPSLTARETEVLRELARGRSNAEIGHALYIAEATVKTHVNRILAKLGVRDRVQAVVIAYESGLVHPGTP
jgi:DNA-binding NarL/FixJ family response regulator